MNIWNISIKNISSIITYFTITCAFFDRIKSLPNNSLTFRKMKRRKNGARYFPFFLLLLLFALMAFQLLTSTFLRWNCLTFGLSNYSVLFTWEKQQYCSISHKFGSRVFKKLLAVLLKLWHDFLDGLTFQSCFKTKQWKRVTFFIVCIIALSRIRVANRVSFSLFLLVWVIRLIFKIDS